MFSSYAIPTDYVFYTAPSFHQAGFRLRKALKDRLPCILIDYSPAASGFPCNAYDILTEALRPTGLPDEGDYLDVCIKKCICRTEKISSSVNRFCFLPVYRTTLTQELELSLLCGELRRDLLKLRSPYDQLFTLHKLLTRHCRYKHDPAELSYTAYGALCRQEAVCQGISAAFYRLAMECGFDCRILYGFLQGTSHAWNLIRIGQGYYQLDLTNEKRALRLHASFPAYQLEPAYRSPDFALRYPQGPAELLPALLG